MSFTSEEIIEIKRSKRVGYVFAAAIFAFGGIITLYYQKINNLEYSNIKVVITALMFVGSGLLVLYLLNRKHNKDLASGKKLIETKRIEKKETIIAYEPGSGSLHIPVLGYLFPNIWGQKMKEYKKFRLTINGLKYDIEENLFNTLNEGDDIELTWSFYGETFLGVKKKQTE